MSALSEQGTASATVQGITGFHGVRYIVSDVKRALDFYATNLGFVLEHQQLPAFASVTLGPLRSFLAAPVHRDRGLCRAVSVNLLAARIASYFG